MRTRKHVHSIAAALHPVRNPCLAHIPLAPSLAPMAQYGVSLKMVPTYSIDNTKAEWRVQDSEIIVVNGTQFVQLKKGKANRHGFPRLVFAKLDVDDRDKSWTRST